MKRGTIEHWKTDALATALKVPHLTAVGILESLWHYCSRYAPRGDIGKAPDVAIAKGIKWCVRPDNTVAVKDATRLINALISSRWLEKNTEFRLIVHDWHDHADDAVRKYLSRNGLSFWNNVGPYARQKGSDQAQNQVDSKPRSRRSRDKVTTSRDFVVPASAVAKPLPTPVPSQQAATFRTLRLSCGEFGISEAKIELWRSTFAQIDITASIDAFEKHYTVENISAESVEGRLAAWLRREDPQRQKKKSETISIKDAVDFTPDMTPTEFSGDVFAAVVYYKNAIKYNRPEQIEAMKGERELYRKVLEQIALDNQVESVEENLDF